MACHLIIRGHLSQPPLSLSFLCPFRSKVISNTKHTNEPHQKYNKANCLMGPSRAKKTKNRNSVRTSISMHSGFEWSSFRVPELLQWVISLLIYKSTVSRHLKWSPYLDFLLILLYRSPVECNAMKGIADRTYTHELLLHKATLRLFVVLSHTERLVDLPFSWPKRFQYCNI